MHETLLDRPLRQGWQSPGLQDPRAKAAAILNQRFPPPMLTELDQQTEEVLPFLNPYTYRVCVELL